jgi:SAM-dependent methyltransferase
LSHSGDLRAYHKTELQIARDPSHPAHVSPPASAREGLVLDIGCGAGQTLLTAVPRRFAVGLDIDAAALSLAREWSTGAEFVCGRAELLPFPDAQFQNVWARVSLAYTHLTRSLPEIRRVLKPGGSVWMVLHGFSIPWNAAKSGGPRWWIYFAYILLNSALFHCCGKMFGIAGRYESFQTQSGIERALARLGFHDILIHRAKHFVVTAHL